MILHNNVKYCQVYLMQKLVVFIAQFGQHIFGLALFSVDLIKSLTKKLNIGMASQMLKLYLNKAKQNMILNHRRSEPKKHGYSHL
jgi:hypothetical protein